ncbi:DNA polymerase III subunit gamma/tau [Pseudomarimonas arenosa]|uniref:DNA polymerase III subunit gamma/tau n=1 Tax=Pseudomarimonas arenosa TaxID=2774145 RepID=A0AAW3ZJT5_9GAMM|nr:DNA polymerase III subunit gamma/tau [Pseudomarimonas arenosa]MBD8526028.1 DNA polymerase III subunit gamma/tau [Pseudomarimonas arenosa]
MSYLVLARKWRPKRFAELVGQEHVVRALTHALDSGRVHHAFLFTGTRGVGKTTIARIFAKSLNCERGVGADPCGECPVCTAVDAGRFVDLIEIDAASNTGVDDVRELIDNAQYMPTRGRYKVYLVDEVHMLSRNAFNALLKTLEEPPEHVKFLLATTDPQKLPVTVLSRCLQFNLKRLTEAQIGEQICKILAAESIDADETSIRLLAHGADGSLRDGLSLLDQAISYGAGALRSAEVAQMLGSVDRGEVEHLLAALSDDDGQALLAAVDSMASYSADFSAALDALASALHQVQIRQLVPTAAAAGDSEVLIKAAELPPELIALWYQMAVSGRRELPLAPSARVGMEMILLRMLAFADRDAPVGGGTTGSGGADRAASSGASSRAAAAAAIASLAPADASPRPALPTPSMPAPPAAAPVVASSAPFTAPPVALDIQFDRRPSSCADSGQAQAISPPIDTVPSIEPMLSARPVSGRSARRLIVDSEDWIECSRGLGLRGPAGQLAAHAQFLADDGETLRLALPEVHDMLKMPELVQQLCRALQDVLGGMPRIEFGSVKTGRQTLHARLQQESAEQQSEAERSFMSDPTVQSLIQDYGARVVPGSIRPH